MSRIRVPLARSSSWLILTVGRSHNMSWRQVSLGIALLGLVVVVGLWIVPSHHGSGEARFRALLRAEHLRQKLEQYRFSPVYRKIAKLTKVDFIERERQRAEQLDLALLRSGDLVSLWFFVPNLQAQESRVRTKLDALMRVSTDQVGRWWLNAKDDWLCVHCRPGFVVSAQSAFCCITNRVPWGPLRALGGSRDDVDCYLPDGSLVDLDRCQKWLNESVAAGWRVGVMAKSERPGRCVLVVTRRKGSEKSNQSIEPTGGSRFCPFPTVSQWRLPPVAHTRH